MTREAFSWLLTLSGGIVIGYMLARAVDAGRQLSQPGELARRFTKDGDTL